MAYVLKTDETVLDPNGSFDYLTSQGVATKDIADFVKALENENYNISSSEFTALKNFVSGLKDLGVWENIIEFLPMYGSTIDAQLVKLKYENSQAGIVVNNLNQTNVDSGKGLIWNSHTRYDSPCVDLDLTQAEILSKKGFGTIMYSKATGNGVHSRTGYFGAGDGIGQGMYLSTNSAASNLSKGFLQSLYAIPNTDMTVANILFTTNKVNNSDEIFERSAYYNGSEVSLLNTKVSITTGGFNNTSFYLGALNVETADPNGTTEYSYYGGIRLFIMHDGNIPVTLADQINTLTNNFITASNKTFT